MSYLENAYEYAERWAWLLAGVALGVLGAVIAVGELVRRCDLEGNVR